MTIVDVQTHVRPRLIKRNSQPIQRIERHRVAFPLLLDPECRDRLRGFAIVVQVDQDGVPRHQTQSDNRLLHEGPAKGAEAGQLDAFCNGIVLYAILLDFADFVES